MNMYEINEICEMMIEVIILICKQNSMANKEICESG